LGLAFQERKIEQEMAACLKDQVIADLRKKRQAPKRVGIAAHDCRYDWAQGSILKWKKTVVSPAEELD
jgi:hypothetical protein